MGNIQRKIVERKIKEKILEKILDLYTEDEIAEWLYEEYGIKITNKKQLKKIIIKSPDITPQDLALLALDKGYNPEKEWIKALQNTNTSILLYQFRVSMNTKPDAHKKDQRRV